MMDGHLAKHLVLSFVTGTRSILILIMFCSHDEGNHKYIAYTRRLVRGLSQRRSEFDPTRVHAIRVVEENVLRSVYRPALLFFLLITIPLLVLINVTDATLA
jgi:hypothetical protein